MRSKTKRFLETAKVIILAIACVVAGNIIYWRFLG
jgi:hypothetical protein